MQQKLSHITVQTPLEDLSIGDCRWPPSLANKFCIHRMGPLCAFNLLQDKIRLNFITLRTAAVLFQISEATSSFFPTEPEASSCDRAAISQQIHLLPSKYLQYGFRAIEHEVRCHHLENWLHYVYNHKRIAKLFNVLHGIRN